MTDLKLRLSIWYDTYIVKGWYKTWTVWLSVFAVIGPELLQVAADNLDLVFSSIPSVSDSTKNMLRLMVLCAIPVIRAIKQTNLPAPVEPKRIDPT